tara:strand:+ start:1012 stop:1224 length:213 start_codon:yes stop_codon:yes gene_type:complete
VALRLRPKTTDVVDSRAFERLWGLPEMLGVFVVTGVDDLLVHLSVSDAYSLRDLMLEGISSIEGVVDERT